MQDKLFLNNKYRGWKIISVKKSTPIPYIKKKPECGYTKFGK
jgi:hypothetical protein